MPSIGGMFSGGAGGAGTGFLIGGAPGAIIGGGLGLLTGLFESSPEARRRDAINEGKAALTDLKMRTLERGRRQINEGINKAITFTTAGAARRAAGAGVTDAEGYIIPAQTNVVREGAQALSSFEANVNNNYDNQIAQLEIGAATSPLSPSPSDYLLTVGEAAAKFKLNQDYIGMLKGADPTQQQQTQAPSGGMNFDTQFKSPYGNYSQMLNGRPTGKGAVGINTFNPDMLAPKPQGFR